MRYRLFYMAMTVTALTYRLSIADVNGQKVRLDFPKTFFRDDFVSDSGHWKELSNASNLLLLQKASTSFSGSRVVPTLLSHRLKHPGSVQPDRIAADR